MADMQYEYKSVKLWGVNHEYERGWEPVPNVPIASITSGNISDNWIQIRRPLDMAFNWTSFKIKVKRNKEQIG